MANGEVELLDVIKSLAVSNGTVEGFGLSGASALGRTDNQQVRMARSDLDNTRYFARPGEIVSSWTKDVEKLPVDAAPFLSPPGGVFSVKADNVGGQALVITGPGKAGPLGLIRLGDKPTEITFFLSSLVDDPVAANNTPILRWRAISRAGNDLGDVDLPSAPVLKSGGLRRFTFLASTTAGVGTVNLPANTQYLRPQFGNPGGTNGTTTGQLACYTVEHRDKTDTVGSLISDAPLATTTALSSLLAFVDTSGNSGKMSLDSIFAIFRKVLDPVTYPVFLEKLRVSQVSHIVTLDDSNRDSVTIQCLTADIAINFEGRQASFDGTTPCAYQFAGEIKTYKGYGKAPISILARQPIGGSISFPAVIDVTLGRLTDDYVAPVSMTGDDRMSFWPNQKKVDPRFRAAVRIMLNELEGFGILDKLRYLFVPGADEDNNAINLANPSGPKLLYVRGANGDGVQTVPYSHIKFNGVDAWANTQLLAADLLWDTAGHFLSVQVGDTVVAGSTYAAGSSGNLAINPNRTTTQAAVRSGSGTDLFNAALGAYVALNRTVASGIDGWAEDVKTNFPTRVLSATPSGALFLGAIPGTGGAAALNANRIRVVAAGAPLNSDLSVTRTRSSIRKLLQSCDAILAAPMPA